MIRSKLYDKTAPDPAQCNGCGVCMLSCPVWRQHHTKALTYCGRSRASIGGATAEELAPSARACILCGSCEPLCPMGIRTQQLTMMLRRSLVQQGLLPKPEVHHYAPAPASFAASRVLLPGKVLRADEKRCASVFALLGRGVACYSDDGEYLIRTLESGGETSDGRVRAFMGPLLRSAEVIVADGLLFNLLRPLLPASITVRPLGQALLALPAVRAGLRQTDFYMIETRAYNAGRKKFVPLYDAVRRETGCFMNLDLQRVATPTGAASYQHREGFASVVSIEAQVSWLLEGRKAERVVVEHLDDHAAFTRYTSLPVVYLAEVANR